MKSFATFFALAVVLVPAAHAAGSQPMSDVQLSRHQAGIPPLSDVQLSRPAHVGRFSAPISDVQSSRYGGRIAASAAIVSTSAGFDWADFSIGAGSALGAVLLAAAAALGLRNTRGRVQSA